MRRHPRLIRYHLASCSVSLVAAFSVGGCFLARGAEGVQSDYQRELTDLDLISSRAPAGLVADVGSSDELWRADLLFRRASFTECLTDLRAAKDAFDRLGRIEDLPNLALARARLALQFHSVPEARRALAEAAGDAPESVRALLAFDLALQAGQYDEARQLALTWDREDASAEELCRKASLAAFEGQDERADRLLARAEDQLTVKEMRFFAWVALERGSLKFRAGDLAAAAAHYRRAEKAWSGWWRVEQRKAELLAAQGQFAESEALYRLLCSGHDRPELEQELGEMLLFQKKEEPAAECFRRALAAYLDSAGRGEVLYLHHLASLYSEGLPNYAEAIRWAQADVAARGTTSARDAFAWAHYFAGDYATAAKETHAALASGCREPHVLYHSSMILMAAGEIEEAGKLLHAPAVLSLINKRTFHAHR